MRVETLKSLIGATHLSSPAITSIDNIVFDAKKVQRGDLFFAFEFETIALAVQNGAYAIIVDKVVEVIDPEIAWLRVDSLKDSSIKLLRYHLEQTQKEFILLNSFEFEILSQINISKQVQFLHNSQKDIFTIFDPNKKIFFCDDSSFLKSFCKEYKEVKNFFDSKKLQLLHTTLYSSNFVYEDILYKNIPLAPFYIDFFINAVNICENFQIQYNIQKLEYCNFFYPQFLTSNLTLTEFGKGSKVLLFCQEKAKVAQYIAKHLHHLKVFYFEKGEVEKLYESLKNYDLIVVTNFEKMIVELPPFIQKNDTPTLF